MPVSGLPFDDVRALFPLLPPASGPCVADVRAREAELVKPAGGLGRLEEIVEWLAAWQGRSKPDVSRPLVAIFAASHGVAGPGASATTRAMMETYAAGGGAVNQICATHDLGLKVFELALDIPTGDIRVEPAFDEAGCAATIAFGMEAIAGGTDLLCLGQTSVGGEIAAAALCLGLYGGSGADWAIDPTHADAIETAVALHRGHLADPLEALRRLGGREIAASCGAILAARMERIPVILDGFVVTAAAAVLRAIAPASVDHCLAAQARPGGAHGELLRRLGKTPLLDLGISMEEGAAAALAAGIVKAALACHVDMATRTQAGIVA